jgi:hypothetical protein
MMQHRQTRDIGLDVQKATTAVASLKKLVRRAVMAASLLRSLRTHSNLNRSTPKRHTESLFRAGRELALWYRSKAGRDLSGGSFMDELERLIKMYRGRARSCPDSKVNVLMDLERVRDPRVVPFLLTVLRDRDESEEVRMHVVKELRSGPGLLVPQDRPRVAEALRDVLVDPSEGTLRLEAALALGEFVDIVGVFSQLSTVCLAQDESIDLRYAVFTSLERSGPAPGRVALFRLLASDETLGPTAQSVLSAWQFQ